jgi:hypothetical protein
MATDPHALRRDAAIEAQRILARHLEPYGPDCKSTISALTEYSTARSCQARIAATEAQRRD